MNAPTREVTATVEATHVQADKQLAVRLRWTRADPLAVTLTFLLPRRGFRRPQPVTWHVGRDLLSEGLVVASGDGDVRVEPFPGGLLITLTHETRACFVFDRDDVAWFLADTYDAVPPGAEFALADLDRELTALLGGTR